ncbi:hypothetical protein MNBD_GAMMA09-2130 [hydrothermal vent metagenome]|uniref:Uncharacterized protein n=1 Tax=hydrothermal vent metagenome TaxID=652676 RepID=A0A3B0XPM7_9ZZZZ
MYIFNAIIFFLVSVCSVQAKEYPAEYLIDLEKKFNTLRSEIYITSNTEPDSYRKQNAALYHIKKGAWGKSIKRVQPDKTSAAGCQDYNNILYGISMQGLKNKKSALNFYRRVYRDSVHYATAQLNIASIYQREGRAEKAILTIRKVLSDSSVLMDVELTNKLLFTLANIYIRENRYLESMKILRRIETRSIYSSRAMIALAFSALEIKDYSTALNTLNYLLNNNQHDLAGDESYITIAFLYESKGDYIRAAEYYKRAVAYYKKRINKIDIATNRKKALKYLNLRNKHNFIVNEIQIDLIEELPAAFFDTYFMLEKLVQRISESTDVKNEFHDRAITLYHDYRKVIKQLLHKQLKVRKKILTSYLKQSNYGFILSNDQLVSEMEIKNHAVSE